MNDLKAQLESVINKCGGFFGEYELNDGEYLLVHISAYKDGLHIAADFDETYFSCDVIKTPTGFYMPFDEYFDDLDHYLQAAGDEIEDYLNP